MEHKLNLKPYIYFIINSFQHSTSGKLTLPHAYKKKHNVSSCHLIDVDPLIKCLHYCYNLI